MNIAEPLGQEWMTLQNNHEHYERGALALKLVTVAYPYVVLLLGLLVLHWLR